MIRSFPALVLALTMAAPISASARDAPPPLTVSDVRDAATYSAICGSDDTGDLSGVRVFVRAPGARPRIVVQVAEGDLGPLVAARSWSTSGRLYFAAPATGASPAVAGEVRRGSIRLTEPYGDTLTLPLRDDRRGFPICD